MIMIPEQNHIYYLIPLHNGRYNYGYCVISDKSKLMLGHMDLHSNLEKLMLAFQDSAVKHSASYI